MFANTTMGGMCFGFPDVCNTPSPVGPVPIPYPNTGQYATANPSTCSQKVFIMNMPIVTKKSEVPMSQGDNAGVAGGVASGTVMGPDRHTMGSARVKIEGDPATKMPDPTGHNGSSLNAMGSTLAPSQTKVMILS
jgi:hypothetical protein